MCAAKDGQDDTQKRLQGALQRDPDRVFSVHAGVPTVKPARPMAAMGKRDLGRIGAMEAFLSAIVS